MRNLFLFLFGFVTVILLFAIVAPLACLWPTLAWRNRLSLLAGRWWGSLCLRLAGVRVHYRGRENLVRPAILTFNHTHITDFFINASVAGTRCMVFGKQKLARIPFVGWAWWFGGHPLIKREDRVHWQGQLDRVERLCRDEGYSLIVAPEGTRSRTGELRPFKKGPFHLAVNTRLPIVPVVIHGLAALVTGDVLLPRPGRIDVEVLPPIPTDDWSIETLDAHVAALREVYERHLTPTPTA